MCDGSPTRAFLAVRFVAAAPSERRAFAGLDLERGEGGVEILGWALRDGFHDVDTERPGFQTLFEGEFPKALFGFAAESHHHTATNLCKR